MFYVKEEKSKGGWSPVGFQLTSLQDQLSHSAVGIFASIAILGFDYQSEGSQCLCFHTSRRALLPPSSPGTPLPTGTSAALCSRHRAMGESRQVAGKKKRWLLSSFFF